MSTDRRMDKHDVVHIDTGMSLRHKKEWIWVNCHEVDEHRAYYTEWSKLERENGWFMSMYNNNHYNIVKKLASN